MAKLTQAERLVTIDRFIQGMGYAPSLRDLQVEWGASTHSLVAYHLAALRHQGLIEFSNGLARTIVLTDKGREIIEGSKV